MKIHRRQFNPAISVAMMIWMMAFASLSFVQGQNHAQPDSSPLTAPLIVRDTVSDSPGTNIVTRIVTITAELGGSPPLTRQWKVDHGKGFVAILGATNATFRIGNAQPSDSGLYALFASNPAGRTNTTPVPLIVVEGED